MVQLSLFNNKTQLLRAEAGALFFAVKDSRTPLLAKFVAIGIVAYAFSPIDLIPDFIPVLGWLDDLLIIGFGLRLVKRLIPASVWEESKVKAVPLESAIKIIYKRIIWTLIIVWAIMVLIAVAIVIAVLRYFVK